MALKCLIKRIIFYYSLISIITKIIIPIIIGLIHLLLNKAHRVEREPYRLSPERSDPGLNPARVFLLNDPPSHSHTFLSVSLYNKA